MQVVPTGKDDAACAEAERLAAELVAAGVRVLLDDRKASPGVKFKDAELLGVPTILIVGRGLADGVVELRDRRSGERRDVPVGDAVTEVQAACVGRTPVGSVGRSSVGSEAVSARLAALSRRCSRR